jgi:hypothetical protein
MSTERKAKTDYKSLKDRPSRIEIDGDTLLLDDEFCRLVLAGCSKRTAKRHEDDGLPFVMLGGAKYRPLKAGREWLANRITRKNQPPKRRRA